MLQELLLRVWELLTAYYGNTYCVDCHWPRIQHVTCSWLCFRHLLRSAGQVAHQMNSYGDTYEKNFDSSVNPRARWARPTWPVYILGFYGRKRPVGESSFDEASFRTRARNKTTTLSQTGNKLGNGITCLLSSVCLRIAWVHLASEKADANTSAKQDDEQRRSKRKCNCKARRWTLSMRRVHWRTGKVDSLSEMPDFVESRHEGKHLSPALTVWTETELQRPYFLCLVSSPQKEYHPLHMQNHCNRLVKIAISKTYGCWGKVPVAATSSLDPLDLTEWSGDDLKILPSWMTCAFGLILATSAGTNACMHSEYFWRSGLGEWRFADQQYSIPVMVSARLNHLVSYRLEVRLEPSSRFHES